MSNDKQEVDVLFIPAPLQFKNNENYLPVGDECSTPPIGLMYIATYLNSIGYCCKILEVGLKQMSLSDTITQIEKIKPRIVGISILTPSTITAVQLAREVKKRLPNIIIGCGGIHISVDPTFSERYPCFDFSVTGEGEYIMAEIIDKINRGEKVNHLYEGGYIKDLDKLPFPDYNLINFKEYGYPLDKIGKKRAPIAMITSRGCPFSCSFCCKSETRKYVRYRSSENIIEEIQKNYSISHGEYSFMDDTMTLNQKNTIEVCKGIMERKLKISWVAMTRADSITSKLAKLLRLSGCRELFLGVESGDKGIRNEVIKKRIEDKDIFNTIKILRKVGIRSSIFLMLGFPSEGPEEIEKTVNYPKQSKADIAGFHLTLPLPGSELFNKAIEQGIIPLDIIDQYTTGKLGNSFLNWPIYIPKGLSLEDLKKARSRGIRKFYMSFFFISNLLFYYLRFPSRIRYDKHLFRTALSILLKGKSLVQFS